LIRKYPSAAMVAVDRQRLTTGSGKEGSFVKGSGIGSFALGQKIPGAHTGTVTAGGATMTIMAITVGAGVLTLPAATGLAGIIWGFGVIVLCGVIAVSSGVVLCDAIPLAEEQGHTIKCFEDLGEAAGGALGKNLTLILMQVMNFGIACIFILIAGQNLGLIVDTAAQSNTKNCQGVFALLMNLNGTTFGGWMLVAALLTVPTLFMWDITAVSKFAPLGILGAVMLIASMILGSIIYCSQNGLAPIEIDRVEESTSPVKPILIVPQELRPVISIFCKAIFSFAGTFCVPTLHYEMAQKEKMRGAVLRAMSCVLCIYVIVCIPTIMAFGQPEGGGFLGNFAKFFLYFGAVGIVVHVLCALPIIFNLVFTTYPFTQIEAMKTMNPLSLLIRFMVLAFAWIIPEVASVLGALVDLVTSVTIIGLMIFLPVWFNFTLRMRKEGSFGASVSKIGVTHCTWQVIMVCIGIFGAIEGIKAGISELSQTPSCPI